MDNHNPENNGIYKTLRRILAQLFVLEHEMDKLTKSMQKRRRFKEVFLDIIITVIASIVVATIAVTLYILIQLFLLR